MRKYVIEFVTDARVLFIAAMWVVYLATAIATGWHGWSWCFAAAGVFVFFVVEYVIHRFVLHGLLSKLMPKAYEGHEYHHAHPTEMRYLLTPNAYNVPNHFLVWIVLMLLTQSVHRGSAVMVGFTFLQLYYEWTHFVSHRPIVPLTRWGKWMKKYHLLHHFKYADGNYGVTNPLFDKLMGTDGPMPGKQTPSKDNTFHS